MDDILAAIHCAIAKKEFEKLQNVSPTSLLQPTVGLNNNITGFSPLKGTTIARVHVPSSPGSMIGRIHVLPSSPGTTIAHVPSSPVLPNKSVQLSPRLLSPGLYVPASIPPNALAIPSGHGSVPVPNLPVMSSVSSPMAVVGIPTEGGTILPPPTTLSSATKSLANILAEMHKQQKRSNGRYSGGDGGRQNTGNIPSLLNLNTKSTMNQSRSRSQSSNYMNQNNLLSPTSSSLGGMGSSLGGGYGNSLGGGYGSSLGGLGSSLGGGLGSSLGGGLGSSLGGGYGSSLGGGLGSSLGGGLGSSLGGGLGSSLGGGLGSSLGGGYGSSLGGGLGSSLGGGYGSSLGGGLMGSLGGGGGLGSRLGGDLGGNRDGMYGGNRDSMYGGNQDSMYGSGSSMWQSDMRSQQQQQQSSMGSSLLGNPPMMSSGSRFGGSRDTGVREDDFAAKVRLQQAMLAQEGIGGGRRSGYNDNNNRNQQNRRGNRKRSNDEMYDPTRPTDDYEDEPSRKRGSRDKKGSTTGGTWRCNVCNSVSINLQEYKIHMNSQSHKNAINRIKMVANFQTDQAKARMQAQQHLRMIEGNRGKGGSTGPRNSGGGGGGGGGKTSGPGAKGNTGARGGDRHFCRECQIFFHGSTVDHRQTNDHQDAKKRVQQSRRYCKICNTTFTDNQKYQAHCSSARHKKECEAVRRNKGNAKSEDFVTVDAIGIFEEEIDEGSETNEDTTAQQEELDKDQPNGTVKSPRAAVEASNDNATSPTETSAEPVEVGDESAEVDADKVAEVDADKVAEVDADKVAEVDADKVAEVDADKVAEVDADKVAEVDADKVAEPEQIVADKAKPIEPETVPIVNESIQDSETTDVKPVPSETSTIEEKTSEVTPTSSEISDPLLSAPEVSEKPKPTPEPTVVPAPKPASHRPKRRKQESTDSPTGSEPEDDELTEYDPNTPVGQGYVVPVSGFFCKLCHKFYLKKTLAKVTHCSSRLHFNAVKIHLIQKKKENAVTEVNADESQT